MRAIEAASIRDFRKPDDFGPACDLQWLPVERLRIDDRYQRQITNVGRSAVRKIAENFAWRFFTPVIVSPVEGGLFAIIDGQHRTTAAATCGIETVPCSIVIASARDQASAFKTINGSITRLFPYQIYRAALAAGDPKAEALDALVRKAGVIIQTPGTEKRPDGTLCVWVIEKLAGLHGEGVVVTALRCLRDTSPEGESWLRVTPITAVSSILASHPHWLADEGRLYNAFSLFDFAEMWERSATKALQIKGSGISVHLQAVLVERLAKAMGDRPSTIFVPARTAPPRPSAAQIIVDRRPSGDQTARLMGDPPLHRSALGRAQMLGEAIGKARK